MKKLSVYLLIFLFIVLIFLATKMVFAQESFTGSFLSTGLSYAPSLISGHNIVAQLSYLRYFGGWFGVGLGTDVLYNINYEDLYINAFIKLALRRLYFEGGITYNVIASNHQDMIVMEEIYPYFALRFDLIMSETEKGAFNINILIGMIFTSFPVMIVEDAENIFAQIIASAIANGVGIFLNSIKIGIGFTYTFYLG